MSETTDNDYPAIVRLLPMDGTLRLADQHEPEARRYLLLDPAFGCRAMPPPLVQCLRDVLSLLQSTRDQQGDDQTVQMAIERIITTLEKERTEGRPG